LERPAVNFWQSGYLTQDTVGAGGTQTLVELVILDEVGVGVSDVVGGAVVVSGELLSAQSTL
jgi:coproporphyrinogen III oxidase